MKLLATSDLHNRRDWYGWILSQAPKYEVVVIAGDLLDMFQDLQPQIEFLRSWVADMRAVGTPLMVCCGNHDFNSTALPWPTDLKAKLSPEQAAFMQRARLAEHWMDALVDEGACVVSGMVKTFPDLDNLIVSSLFYGRDHEEANVSLLEQGALLRRASPRSPWIVLHHEPPVGLLGSPELGNRLFNDWIEECQPKMVFCGHDHDSPARNGSCCDRIGMTYVFNPGYRSEGKYPCHIEIDTVTMKHKESK